jgi:tetratricopeptide (TPR) repeat protein
MCRQLLLICSTFVLLAGPALGQEAPTSGDKSGTLKKSGFNLSDFENQAVSKDQMAKMKTIANKRVGIISKLEKLLRDRPLYPRKAEVYFRLGELNWQQAKYVYLQARNKYDQDMEAFEGKRLATEPVEPKEDYTKALSYYRKVIQQFPDYTRIDQVMFFLGRGALEQGKRMQDRNLAKEGVQYLQKLVGNYPQSRYIAQSHLALGEHFFENDSLYYAKRNYEKIINDFPKAAMFNYALYKLGWVYFNLREFRKTVTTFQKVVANIGNQTGQVSFRDQALNDLVKTWAEMDDSWREALDYFKTQLALEPTYDKMEKLAALKLGFDKDQEAIELYNHFIERTPQSVKTPEWFGALIEVRKKINDFGDLEKEIRRVVAFYNPGGRWMNANKANEEASAEAIRLGEVNLLYLANHWHLSAEKAEKQRKVQVAAKLYIRAAKDYKLFLERYSQSTKAYVINFYYAEILYHQLEDYREAIKQYKAVMLKDKKGKFIEDAALGVIYSSYEEICRKKIRKCGDRKGGRASIEKIKLNKKQAETARKKESEKIERTALDPLEQDYITAADTYVRILLELRKDPDFMKKKENKDRGTMIPEVMYMAADTFFVHGDFANAVERLKKIFEYDPKHKFAAIASVRMIQAYARLRRWQSVEEWARKLIKQRNYKFKSKEDLQRYIAIAINERAIDLMKQQRTSEAIAESERLIREFKSDKELRAKAMMNLAALYERAKRIKEAVTTYERVVREFKKSSVAPEAQFVIGQLYESQTRFKESAEAFLKMSKFKDNKQAATAVANAAFLRKAMEDYPGAIDAFKTFLKLFPKHENAAQVYLEIGYIMEVLNDDKNLKTAIKHYQKFGKKYASEHVRRVEASTRTGRLLRELDSRKQAQRNAKRKEGKPIKKVYNNRKKASAAFAAAVAELPNAMQQVKAMGAEGKNLGPRAKNYAAESMYWIADYVFQDFDDAKIPSTLNPTKLKEALLKKADLHQQAEKKFDQVLMMGDAGWLACAAFRNGLLYYNFAKELFDVPIPFGLSVEQEDEYRAILEEIASPVQEKSLLLLKAALQAAHEKGVYNKCAKDSGVYASKVSPEEYPVDGEDQVNPNKTKDTLLSANFIRYLRRGDTSVDTLKKTREEKAKTGDSEKTAPATGK